MSFPIVFHPGGQESSGMFRIAAPGGVEIGRNGLKLAGGEENNYEFLFNPSCTRKRRKVLMKAPFLAAVALVAIALTAAAQTGPTSTLYLTASQNGQNSIVVVQGNSITSFPEAYGSPTEGPIAVWGDVRTTGWDHNEPYGGQYTLSGTPTGTTYVLPSAITGGYSWAFDSTSDGSHNYLISWNTGVVY